MPAFLLKAKKKKNENGMEKLFIYNEQNQKNWQTDRGKTFHTEESHSPRKAESIRQT